MVRVKLVSGGIDSVIMSQEFEGINVYIDFGQKYAKEELEALKKMNIDVDVINIESVFRKNNDVGYFINNRNLTFASLLMMLYNPDEIYMAGIKDDVCIDKNEEAFKNMSEIISSFSDKQVKVISPYWNMTKGQLIQNFKNKELLKDTFSCYEPVNGKACGNCNACLRKVIALETNDIDSGITLSDKIINTYLKKIHNYDSDRISRFFTYINKIKKIVAIDIDGVLCYNNGKNYKNCVPIKENIEELNNNYNNCYKVLFTARYEEDRKDTEEWLIKNGVKYDSLIMNKLVYNTLIDDRAVNKYYRGENK